MNKQKTCPTPNWYQTYPELKQKAIKRIRGQLTIEGKIVHHQANTCMNAEKDIERDYYCN